jgi:hypothetical protein
MSPTFTKGLLKGAALAFAGAAALGAGSAKADFSCVVTLGTLGTCAGGTVNGFAISNISLTGLGGLNGFLNFTEEAATAPLTKITAAFNRTGGSSGAVVNGALSFDVDKFLLIGYEATSVSGGVGTFNFSGTNISTVSGVGFGDDIFGSITQPVSTGTYTLAWDKTSGGNLASLSTTLIADVPVPLPVVGAGLAFGFTRRLRKRAKSIA